MAEYHKRVEEKIATGNLIFSYVHMSKQLSLFFVYPTCLTCYCFNLVLDPDYSDENIGKFANAACREFGESNNCYVWTYFHRSDAFPPHSMLET